MKLFHQDCFEGMALLPDKSIDLIVTDPPYEINLSGGKTGSLCTKMHLDKKLECLSDANIDKGYDMQRFASEVQRLQNKINLYVWCNKAQIPEYFRIYVDQMKCKFNIISWHKLNPIPAYGNKYLHDTEFCLYFFKGGYCEPRTYDDARTFYLSNINQADKAKFLHPTIKPVDIIARLVRNSSRQGETVLDPFMGSGTTGVVAQAMGRHFIGYEINEKFFKIAQQRIQCEQNLLFSPEY